MKTFTTIILTLLFTCTAFGQDNLPVLGKIDEIKTFKKVYIDTESSQDRKFILMALKKKKSDLEVVGDPKDAQFFLTFKTLSRQDKKVLIGSEYTETAEMTVYYYNSDKRKVVAWSQNKMLYQSSGLSISSPNSYDLTRKFVNALTGKDK
jgi:hypothetical protein